MAPTLCIRCGDALEEGCDPKDELAELDALLERLRLKRYDLQRKINQSHSPIVCQLPPDVTSTIFEFCLPDFADSQILASEKPFSPLYLGAICSYWRNIAWSTPSLWSSLVVCNPSERDPDMVIEIVREWLGRSGRLPLSIRILSTSYNESVSSVIDIVNQYSTRWSELDLYIPDGFYQRFRTSDNHAVIHAPALKAIRIHRPTHRRARASASNLNFQLPSCPRLEIASLTHFPMDGSNIQLDNLTHLTLHSMSLIDTFRILRKTPRLVFFHVSGSSFCSRYREQSITLPVLSSLRSLQLQVKNCAEDFLNNLIAPHLEEFHLSRFHMPRIVVVTSFLRKSACSLRSLSMIFSVFPQYFDAFMNVLQSMPSLTKLSLMSLTTSAIPTTDIYHPRSIFQLVSKVLFSQSTSPQQGFLPNLKILEYTGKLYLHSGNYDKLYPLPPANNGVHGPLHLLKLDLHPANCVPKNLISYISSLARRGVTVNVLSDSQDILQSSIDNYRTKKEFLSQDWIDNLDSSLFF